MDRQKVITIAHPEHSSGEPKIRLFIKAIFGQIKVFQDKFCIK